MLPLLSKYCKIRIIGPRASRTKHLLYYCDRKKSNVVRNYILFNCRTRFIVDPDLHYLNVDRGQRLSLEPLTREHLGQKRGSNCFSDP